MSVRTATVTGMTSPLFIEPIYPRVPNDLHAVGECARRGRPGRHRVIARVGPCTPIQRENK
jgi:hypothetical protein